MHLKLPLIGHIIGWDSSMCQKYFLSLDNNLNLIHILPKFNNKKKQNSLNSHVYDVHCTCAFQRKLFFLFNLHCIKLYQIVLKLYQKRYQKFGYKTVSKKTWLLKQKESKLVEL